MNQSYLFVMAHPDDDAFISGTISKKLFEGNEVNCVWLTSGGFMGGAMKREKELFSSAEIMGLKRSCIKLLRLPDLGLINNLSEATEGLLRICDAVKPDNIYVTAFEGGHPDHDCANFVVFEARRRSGMAFNILEFPLYNGAGSVLSWRWKINAFPNEDGMELKLPLTSREIAIRLRVMRTYSSQFIYMIPARLASSTVRMLKSGEPQRLCANSRDHTMKPHPGKLNYERWFNMFMRMKFDDYRRAVEEAMLAK